MVYNNITFKYGELNINLEMNTDITLVRGDSGVGKTYLFNILRELKGLREKNPYKNIHTIDYSTEDVLSELQQCKNKLIVIDNSEVIVDNNIKDFINYDRTNQYLLFGRDCDNLPALKDSFVLLNCANGNITFRKELM